eukprot:4923302-Amphidinium_carterae.1
MGSHIWCVWGIEANTSGAGIVLYGLVVTLGGMVRVIGERASTLQISHKGPFETFQSIPSASSVLDSIQSATSAEVLMSVDSNEVDPVVGPQHAQEESLRSVLSECLLLRLVAFHSCLERPCNVTVTGGLNWCIDFGHAGEIFMLRRCYRMCKVAEDARNLASTRPLLA